ncbi:MAG: hypothetical protein JWM47_1664 [Acidimicrobiales bacterium]|nr:hypothetical protein [Acidimicrobiales bacterium]
MSPSASALGLLVEADRTRPSLPSLMKSSGPLLEAIANLNSQVFISDEDEPALRRFDEQWVATHRGIIAQAEDLVRRFPDSAPARSRLAQALHLSGDTQSAVGAARAALALAGRDGMNVAAAYVAARVLAASGEPGEAEQLLLERSESDETNFLLANLAAERGDITLALERISTSVSSAAVGLRACLLLERGDAQRALHLLRALIREGDQAPAILANAAYALAALGSKRKAIRMCQQAALAAPTSAAISSNLVLFLLADGDDGGAKREIERLRSARGFDDVVSLSSRANIMLAADDKKAALRLLKEGRARIGEAQDPSTVAELNLRILGLESAIGAKSHSQFTAGVRREIDACPVPPAALVEAFSSSNDFMADSSLVREMLHRMSAHSEAGSSLHIESRLAMLEGEFEKGALLAIEWSEAEPLNTFAQAHAVYLASEILQNPERAIKIGYGALNRLSDHDGLHNNLAFALARVRRLDEAVEICSLARGSSPSLEATLGAIDVFAGRASEGLKRYRRASSMAVDFFHGNDLGHFRLLAALNQRLVLSRATLSSSPESEDSLLPVAMPVLWKTRLSLRLLEKAFRMENLDWPGDGILMDR